MYDEELSIFFPSKSSFSRAFLPELTLPTAIFGNTALHGPDRVCVHLLRLALFG